MDFNILCDSLPDSVSVFGENYKIKTDFRLWILMLDLFDRCKTINDRPLDILTAAKCAMHIVMPDYQSPCDLPPITLVRLFEEFALFAKGDLPSDSAQSAGSDSGEQVFDFSADAEIILSSFLKEYGIDLTRTRMHWWKFLALLRSLPADSEFMRVVRLRMLDTTKIADDETRKRLRRAKAAVRIRHRTSADTDI